ncbi:MAG: hypothetical protein JWO49_650 [Arthrobacter sp.]|nr:hypothetical protein [Arthrobacter sp.]
MIYEAQVKGLTDIPVWSGECMPTFTLRPAEYADNWEQVLDTAARGTDLRIFEADGTIGLAAKSVVLTARTPAGGRGT